MKLYKTVSQTVGNSLEQSFDEFNKKVASLTLSIYGWKATNLVQLTNCNTKGYDMTTIYQSFELDVSRDLYKSEKFREYAVKLFPDFEYSDVVLEQI